MGNTYSQVTIQAVFAVKHRRNFILLGLRDDLHRYIAGIINGLHGKSLAVGGWMDHVHIFYGMPVNSTISDFIEKVKANSSRWINEQSFLREKFQWQTGYGCFTYKKSDRDMIIKYIMNQESHHKIKTFREEYLELLNEFDIAFDEKYLFEFYD